MKKLSMLTTMTLLFGLSPIVAADGNALINSIKQYAQCVGKEHRKEKDKKTPKAAKAAKKNCESRRDDVQRNLSALPADDQIRMMSQLDQISEKAINET